MAYTLASSKVQKSMEKHYAAIPLKPIIPHVVEFVRKIPNPASPGRNLYSYITFFHDRDEGLPLMVQETEAGYKVEWNSYAEALDNMLRSYCEKPRKEPGEFRVTLRRAHYFSDDVPDQASRECYKAISPDGSFTATIWADKASPVFQKHLTGERSSWELETMVVVRLGWDGAAGRPSWVSLRDILAETWHPDQLPPE